MKSYSLLILGVMMAGAAAAQTFNIDGTPANPRPQQKSHSKSKTSKRTAPRALAPAGDSTTVILDEAAPAAHGAPKQKVYTKRESTARASNSKTKPAISETKLARRGTASAVARRKSRKALAKNSKKSAAPVAPAGPVEEASVPGEKPKPAPELVLPSITAGQMPSAQLQQQIQNALHNDATLSASALNVAVTDDAVTLTGSVESSQERLDATRMVQSFAGNRRMHESLTVMNAVTPSGRPTTQRGGSNDGDMPASDNPRAHAPKAKRQKAAASNGPNDPASGRK